jgi:hypothetical protein
MTQESVIGYLKCGLNIRRGNTYVCLVWCWTFFSLL